MYVVPSSSSACLNACAPSRVAGREPTTPISPNVRKRLPRRATRATWTARRSRAVRAPIRVACYPRVAGLCHELGLDRRPQLSRGHRALELRLDATVAADEEHPRLALQPPSAHPAVVAARRVVVLVHLDVDEADAGGRELLPHVRDDVDDRAARPARAELRRRERDDEGPVR